MDANGEELGRLRCGRSGVGQEVGVGTLGFRRDKEHEAPGERLSNLGPTDPNWFQGVMRRDARSRKH